MNRQSRETFVRHLATALAIAMSALLAGCFASQQPMFPGASAVPALGDGGRYAAFEQVDGKDRPTETMTVRPRSDGGYDFINEKGAATPATFHVIPGGLHVAQIRLEGNSGYGYALFRIAGNEALVIPAECDKQDQAKMVALGVEIRSKFECRIDKVADPVAFFAGLKTGPSISKLVKE
jgi:hypothetical protein